MAEEPRYDKAYVKRAMILFSAFTITVLYIETMLIPSLPSIAAEYHVDAAEVSLIVSMYLVSGVALSPVVGKLGDIYGKKRVLMYVLPIYMVAVAVTGFSPTFNFIILSRTVQGIGLTVFALMISLIQEEFPKELVPRSLAIITAMFGIGAAVGLPLGSFVSNAFGWQASYHTALPVVVILSALIFIYIRESKYTKPNVKVDYIGATSLAIALGMIVFALSEGTAIGWTSPTILSLFGIGVALFIFILFYEKKHSEPILSAKLLRVKNVMSANLITLISGLVYFFSYQAFAYLFESKVPLGFGYTIFQTGLALAPFAIANAIVAPVAGRYIPRIGVKPFFYIGSVIAIIGFAIASLVAGSSSVIIGETISGIGVALVNIPTINLLVLSIDRREMGIATAMNSVFRFLGSALGAPVAGILIAQYASKIAFTYSFYLAIGTMALTIVFALFADEIFGKNRKVSHIEEQVSV